MGTQQFCLRWNNHQTNLLHVFDTLLQSEALVDVTVACDGLSVKAHKVVLSACSPYFQSLFLDNPCQHPIVILKDISFVELKCIIEFMYKGEVNVTQENLTAFLKAAETLKVKGLAEVASNETATKDPPPSEIPLQPASSILPHSPMTQDPKSTPQTRAYGNSSPTPRRKRFCRPRRPSSSSESDNRELHADSSKNSIEDENRRLINAIKKEAGLDENSADESLLAKLSSAVTGTTQACVDARSPALGNRDSSDSQPAASTCQSSIASQEHLWSSGDHVQTNADGLMSSNQDEFHNTDDKDSGSTFPYAEIDKDQHPSFFTPSASQHSAPLYACPQSTAVGNIAASNDDCQPSPVSQVDLVALPMQESFSSVQQENPMKESNIYTCRDCGKKIRLYSNFVRHRKLHQAVRECYSCPLCNAATYTRKDNLNHHLKTRHNVTSLRALGGTGSDVSFSQASFKHNSL